jgi:hypothetical protein
MWQVPQQFGNKLLVLSVSGLLRKGTFATFLCPLANNNTCNHSHSAQPHHTTDQIQLYLIFADYQSAAVAKDMASSSNTTDLAVNSPLPFLYT